MQRPPAPPSLAVAGSTLLHPRLVPEYRLLLKAMTMDVSNEAGTRCDQNITGFRCEEMFGFNAEPYVRTGQVQKVLGL